MCRFERDMNFEKEEQLLCWGCMIKHPRESFLPADDATPGVEMCRVSAKSEERICRFKFADLVFVDTRQDPMKYGNGFFWAHWQDLRKRGKGFQADLTTYTLKRITANAESSRRSRDKAIIVEDTMDLCMLCKLPWKTGKMRLRSWMCPRTNPTRRETLYFMSQLQDPRAEILD